MRKASTVLSSIFMVVSFQAYAQQQTVKNAHLFLGKVAEQDAMTFQVDEGRGWGSVSADKSYCQYYGYDTVSGIKAGEHGCSDFKASSHKVEDYKLTSMNMLSRCMTQIKALMARGKEVMVKDGSRDYWLVRIPPRQSSFQIDWSKTTEVRQEGANVIVRGVKPNIRFVMASEQLAIRLAYAMEFLRLECDATSGTEF